MHPTDIPRTPEPGNPRAPLTIVGLTPRHLPRYLTQEEVQAFFRAIDDPRDKALFAIVYLYGLRVSEVALITLAGVDFVRHRIVIRRVKNGLPSERPLFSRVEELLRAYLGDRTLVGPLFPGRRGPLRKRQIQARFTLYRDRGGLSREYTTHGLRHSIATHLLDAGLPLEFVQDHLGHQSIRSTSIYARITDRHREAVFHELEASPWIVQP